MNVIIRNICIVLLTPVVFTTLPLILLFRKEVREDIWKCNGGENSSHAVKRYELPKAFSLLETPDNLLPCDPTEESCLEWYFKYGSYICSWWWLSRNVLHGWKWKYGKSSPKPLWFMSEAEQQEYGVYRKVTPFLCFKLITGWSSYLDRESVYTEQGWWNVPTFSIRFIWQD